MSQVIRLLILVLAVISPALVRAQPDDWRIVKAGGHAVRSCTPVAVTDSTITVLQGSSSMTMALDSIEALDRHAGGHFWTGASYGAIAGLAAGALIGGSTELGGSSKWMTDNFGPVGGNTVLGAACGLTAGFLVGGVLGRSVPDYDRIDLSHQTRAEKLQAIQRIIDHRYEADD